MAAGHRNAGQPCLRSSPITSTVVGEHDHFNQHHWRAAASPSSVPRLPLHQRRAAMLLPRRVRLHKWRYPRCRHQRALRPSHRPTEPWAQPKRTAIYRRADANMAIYNIDSYAVCMCPWRSAAAFNTKGFRRMCHALWWLALLIPVSMWLPRRWWSPGLRSPRFTGTSATRGGW